MRLAFMFVVLAGAIFYSYVAFIDLSFLSRTGRLGPGFFPRLVGVSAVVMTIWVIVDLLRDQRPEEDDASSWGDVVKLMVLALAYAVLLRLFGGFIATVIYLAMTLTVMNRDKYLQNVILSLTFPAGVYLLFDKLLNANMPPALFSFLN
ncbi:tripartite tricarboxylate transporter TctB family protein [Octadecabacter sp.]|nr:tripartite tricarboxylate transporter TctB family protein [Octadecabacter sp.]